MNKETVTVRVEITERVRYAALVQMTRQEFNNLNNALEEESGYELCRVEERIGEYCDRRDDWQDADDLEIEDFCIIENDE